MRLAISLAAALVKVSANRLSAGSPNSSNRRKRLVNTRVLPVPAEAATQALASGSAARCCREEAWAIRSLSELLWDEVCAGALGGRLSVIAHLHAA